MGDRDQRVTGTPPVHIGRLRLRHYRSIRAATIDLPTRLTYLVGPNGAGKSNILDGLRFLSDGLTTSLDQAVRERGGIQEIRWRSRGRQGDISVEVLFTGEAMTGSYGFTLRSRQRGGFEVLSEACSVTHLGASRSRTADFAVRSGAVVSSEPELPLPAPDRLYLVTAASLPTFRPVFDALAPMGFYNLNPAAIREPQPPDPGDLLSRDGRNIASVLHRLADLAPEAKKTIEEYLSAVVPGIVGVDRRSAFGSSLETLEFRQELGGEQTARFFAASMSDGTLRALGVLTAAFQQSAARVDPPVVGIEEPEAAVHPAAAAVLREALAEASEDRQLLVTTHSPDLLDDSRLDPLSILAVESRHGATSVGRPDRAGLTALRDRLYTAGELLRVGQLIPGSDDSAEAP